MRHSVDPDRPPLGAVARRRVAGLVSAACLAGCSSPDGGVGGAAVTRDSAGIRIVESRAAAWPEGAGWAVSDTPAVDIGGGDGGAPYELSRVAGALRLADGRLAVANVATGEVRFYDGQGRYLAASGRPGAGPGEYLMLSGLWLGPGDSLLASDIRAQRLAVLDGRGTFARHFSLGGRSGLTVPGAGGIRLAQPQAWLADGSVLGLEMALAVNQPREGVYRDSLTVLRFAPDGSVLDTIGRFPGIEMEQMTLSVAGQSFASPTPVPLGRQTHVAAGMRRVFVATNDSWQVEERAPGGSVARLIRLAASPVAVTERAIEAHRREQIQAMEAIPELRAVPPEIKVQMTNRVMSARYPAVIPPIAGLIVGTDEMLWVQESGVPGDERIRLAVFDSAGAFQGRVDMPPRFRPTFISAAEVVGVWRDADEVEHVRAYALRR